MQWVKERLTFAGTHILGINGVSGTGSPMRTPGNSRAFSRNDSSNSNTSASGYSGNEWFYGGTPPRTPPPPKTPPPHTKTPSSTPLKTANKEPSGSHFSFTKPPRLAHLKLTPKLSGNGSIGTPVNSGTTSINSSTSSSLRRQRFRQQHHTSRRRLSKTSSTGTSCGSQEHSATGTSLLANPIVDRLLDYVRDNYINSMDPFQWDIQKKIRITSFASFRMETGVLSGIGNFERISDSKLIKSLDESLTTIVLASHIVFTDLLADIRFSARIAKFPMHNKSLRIFLEKCIVYVEISIDHTMTAKVKMLRLISMDGLECKTRGIAFPLNRSLDSFASKTLHSMASRSDQYIEQCIVPLINRFCDNYFESALKSISFTDLFW